LHSGATLPPAATLPYDRHVRRVGLLAILLGALLLRVSIPAGMMLVAGESGPRLAPCSGAATLPVAAPAAHHGDHAQPRQGHDGPAPSPCPFGILLFPALPSAPPVLALQAPEPQPVPALRGLAEALPQGLAHLRPPATGPPAPA